MECAWKVNGMQCTSAVPRGKQLIGDTLCTFHRELENGILAAIDKAMGQQTDAALAGRARLRGQGKPGARW